MNVLVVNFEMDPASGVLAWQYHVARQLARHCRRVVVLTNRIGVLDRPANMEVQLFPRWLFRAPWRLIGGKWWVNVLVWKLCRLRAIDACFIHMNMEWGYRLAPTFAALRIPVLLWYAHGTVSKRLRLAHRCVTRVVTSTPEGFRLPSDKLKVIGQGVNTEVFALQPREAAAADVITVGRISRRKRIDLMVDAFALLCERQSAASCRLTVVGPALTDDDCLYEREVRARVEARGLAGRVVFLGHVMQEDLPPVYRRAPQPEPYGKHGQEHPGVPVGRLSRGDQ